MPPKRNFWPLLGLGICVGTAICTAAILFALWVWLAPKAGWSPMRPPESCRMLRGDVMVRIRPYAEAKMFCGWLGHDGAACASIGADPKIGMPWIMIPAMADPDSPWSPREWALAFEHEASGHGLCKWGAGHPRS